MEEEKNKTANVMSKGGIDQLNKGTTEAQTQDETDVHNKGGIDQLNKGGD